ncbi:hypothetical protein SDRG_11499 [Saprolegnia diclina VS20]|uniref:Uncharacterized protein n=1 Tax=Saprolegnia diclina (strain VS20) TaxID=1156394 RepID=T0QB30_SAPDV|nr:hypothetical protein SDRG_11499 [Saprolegnia diclina VS20]EQC30740.1 hypothetical protein SDRG_11499 [Saprolegnia diclina VS20]|eukprot:XP_008615764.1 hypothetical protein SDRG_11499 [Saprolegnia diclina VS20]
MTTFACLAFMRFDQLRLIGFPPEAKDWTPKRSCAPQRDSVGAKGSRLSRFLVLEILLALKRHGYTLHSSSDVSNSERTRDTLVFSFDLPEESPTMFAISTNASDLLHLLRAPVELQTVVEQLIAHHWPAARTASQDARLRAGLHCTELKFRESPWGFSGMSNMSDDDSACIVLLYLLAALEERGWHLYGSIGQATSISDGRAKDTWYQAVPFAVPVAKDCGDPMAPSAPAYMA